MDDDSLFAMRLDKGFRMMGAAQDRCEYEDDPEEIDLQERERQWLLEQELLREDEEWG